jgi:hypothetical protein
MSPQPWTQPRALLTLGLSYSRIYTTNTSWDVCPQCLLIFLDRQLSSYCFQISQTRSCLPPWRNDAKDYILDNDSEAARFTCNHQCIINFSYVNRHLVKVSPPSKKSRAHPHRPGRQDIVRIGEHQRHAQCPSLCNSKHFQNHITKLYISPHLSMDTDATRLA